MEIELCSECNVFLLIIIVPCAKCPCMPNVFLKRGLTYMVFICMACIYKNKNNLSADDSTLTDERMQNASLEADSNRLNSVKLWI